MDGARYCLERTHKAIVGVVPAPGRSNFRCFAASGQPAQFFFCRTSNQTARLMINPLMMSW
jgi:hypothetical protein